MAAHTRVGAAWAAAAVALLGCSSPAWGSVTIGSDLTQAADGSHNCDSGGANAGCTVIQLALPGRTLTAPFDGVIVRWRVRDYGSGTVTLRVARQVSLAGPPYTFSFVRSSAAQPSGSTGVVTYIASPPIPISAGDSIGVSGSADNIAGHNIAPDGKDGIWGPPPPGFPFDGTTVDSSNIDGRFFDWLYNADIVAPPTSTAAAAGCSGATATVTADPDPATGPKAVHYRLDGGAEQVALTSGAPGTATAPVPAGLHSLEYWGEDQLGQQEGTHHTLAVGCALPVTAAVVSSARETHRTWRRGSHLASIARKRPPVGTTFSFNLDKPAAMRFAFTQRTRGRKVNGKCVAQTRKNRRRPRCNRSVVRGSLGFAGHAGVNSVHFEGWVSRRKTLKPGKYTLAITATTPGAGSTSQRLSFKIAR